MSARQASGSRRLQKRAQERRRHPRYLYAAPVTCRQLGPARAGQIRNLSEGDLRNLSEGGLRVDLPERFPPGTALDLRLPLGERTIHAEVEVVWSQDLTGPEPPACPHGVKFTRLAIQDHLSLKLFLAKTLES